MLYERPDRKRLAPALVARFILVVRAPPALRSRPCLSECGWHSVALPFGSASHGSPLSSAHDGLRPRLSPHRTLAFPRVHAGMTLEEHLSVGEKIAFRIPLAEWQLILAFGVGHDQSGARREVPYVLASIRAAGEDVGLGHPVPSLAVLRRVDGHTRNPEFVAAFEKRHEFLVIDLGQRSYGFQPLADLSHITPPFCFPGCQPRLKLKNICVIAHLKLESKSKPQKSGGR